MARPDTSSETSTVHRENGPRTIVSRGRRIRLLAAITASAIAAVLVMAAPLLGMVTPDAAAAYPSWPLLLVLTGAPAVAAWWLLRRGECGAAAMVLFVPMLLTPGRAIADAQLLAEPELVARPELLLAHTLTPLTPAAGVWLLWAGHAAVLISGALAASAGLSDQLDRVGGAPGTGRQGLLAGVLCAGVFAAVGLLMTPFQTTNAYLLPTSAVDASPAILLGAVLAAIAVPITAGLAVSSTDAGTARGGLLGLALALLGSVVPPLVSVAVLPDVTLTAGPVLGLLAALALAGLAIPAGRARVETDGTTGEVELPAFARLVTGAGSAAVVAGVLALAGALMPQLVMPAGAPEPATFAARLLLPAGAVLVLTGAASLTPRFAATARPALTVVWAVGPLAALGALDTMFTALRLAGAHAGLGAWAAAGAALAAMVSGVLAALAGGVERDDVDLTELHARPVVAVPAVFGLVLALGAFGLPVLTAPDYLPPGLVTGFRLTSWGLVLAVVAVAGACSLAAMSRPIRAAALLCGASLVVAVRLLEFPLTAERAVGAAPGWGLFSGLTCVVVLLATAVIALRVPNRTGSDQPERL